MAIVLTLIGLLFALGSFIFLIANMTSTGMDNFDSAFKRHGLGMAGMAIGGVIMVIGLGLGGYQIIQQIIEKL